MAHAPVRISWKNHSLLIASLLLLIVQIFMRWPSFFEPYWYGDEGIYLTIGQALNRGEILYKDIIDHKTPIIYVLAMVESQFTFRLLLLLFMTVASIAFFYVLKTIIRRPRLSLLMAIFFTVITALPAYEGLIPNGELFVMSFILAGLAIALTQPEFQAMLRDSTLPSRSKKPWLLVISGAFLSLAVLTKVPAVFDVLAIFFIGWLVVVDQILPWSRRQLHWRTSIKMVVTSWFWLTVGLVIPLALSFVYFASVHSLLEYIDYGWLYSFRYSGEWASTAIPADWLWLTDFSFKASVAISLLLAISLIGTKAHRSLRFALGWLVLATFASLLSNRPYPHYFLQMAPPLCLLLSLTLAEAVTWKHHQTKSTRNALLISIVGFVGAFVLVVLAHLSVGMPRYPSLSYYQRFFAFQMNMLSPAEYRNGFNWLNNDNYRLATTLRSEPDATLFIWGTNPVLYALAEKTPVSRFTVSFHIAEFQAQQETIDRLRQEEPTYILVMDGETPLGGLSTLLRTRYQATAKYDAMSLYRVRARSD